MRSSNDELRWMAIQVVGIKRYPLERDLIDQLSDSKHAVRQAARAALVRISRGNDFGPRLKAGKSERKQAVQEWERWWSLQDNNPRRALLRVTERQDIIE
jgi:hypothetical protein